MPDFILSEDTEKEILQVSTVSGGYANTFIANQGNEYKNAVKFIQEDCAIIPTGVLPEGVTWMSPDRRFILWQQRAARKVMDYTPLLLSEMNALPSEEIDKYRRSYALPMPNHMFLIHLDANYTLSNAYLFFRFKYNLDETNKVLIPTLHNIYNDGRICFSKDSLADFKDREKYKTVKDILLGVYNSFWNAALNNDTTEAYNMLVNSAETHSSVLARLSNMKLATSMADLYDPNMFYSNWQRKSLRNMVASPNILNAITIKTVIVENCIHALLPQQNDTNYHNVILFYKITGAMKRANEEASVAGNSF